MPRRKPTWVLERQLENAKKRETYYKNKHTNDSSFKSTVDRRPRLRVGYRSLYKTIKTTTGGETPTTTTDNAIISIIASEAAIRYFEGFAGDNLTDAQNNLGLFYQNVDRFVEASKIGPSQIHLRKGASSPTPDRTEWGTRTIRYSARAAGEAQAFYTAPISVRTGPITPQAVAAAARAVAQTKKTDVGEYGSAWYTLENAPTTLDLD